MDLGPGELAIILVIFLVLFGGKKLPELARSLGQAKKEFESGHTVTPAATPTAPAAEATDTASTAAANSGTAADQASVPRKTRITPDGSARHPEA